MFQIESSLIHINKTPSLSCKKIQQHAEANLMYTCFQNLSKLHLIPENITNFFM